MPLERQSGDASAKSAWSRHTYGLVAMAAGIAAILVAFLYEISDGVFPPPAPPLWLTAPFLLATTAAAAASWLRREGRWWLGASGLGLAAVAAILGWALLAALVIAVTIVVISVIQELL